MKKLRWFIFSTFLLFSAACGATEEDLNGNENSNKIITPTINGYPPAEIDSQAATEGSYPPPLENQDPPQYPAPTDELESNSTYPPPGRIVDENKRVSIVSPVKVGQQSISGTGPPDLPLRVVSISYAGEELGLGSIDGEGAFEISFSRTLEENEVLGIILADESLRTEFQDAPGTDMPMIGFVLAQTIVEP